MYVCQTCGKPFEKERGLGMHTWIMHTEAGRASRSSGANNRGYRDGKRRAWNLGLTKESHPSVMKFASTLAEQYRAGVHVAVPPPMTPARRENLSIKRSLAIRESGRGGFKHVKTYRLVCALSGVEYVLRGTWELRMAEWLNVHGIEWCNRQYFKYFDGVINRTYSPDFFLPAFDVYLEVKGYFKEKDRVKMSMVKSQNDLKLFVVDASVMDRLGSIDSVDGLLVNEWLNLAP